jgi:hypothetical protein
MMNLEEVLDMDKINIELIAKPGQGIWLQPRDV